MDYLRHEILHLLNNQFSVEAVFVSCVDLILQILWAVDIAITVSDLTTIYYNSSSTTAVLTTYTYPQYSKTIFFTTLGYGMMIHIVTIGIYLAILFVHASLRRHQTCTNIWLIYKPVLLVTSCVPFIIICLGEFRIFTLLHATIYFIYVGALSFWILRYRAFLQEPTTRKPLKTPSLI